MKEAPTDSVTLGEKKTSNLRVLVSVKIPETPYTVLRKTRKNRKTEINSFLGYLSTLYYMYHYASIVMPTKTCLEFSAKNKTENSLDFVEAISTNEVLSPTMILCLYEFQAFVTELQTGVYNGASRTLRYILETATEACDFQTEDNRPTVRELLDAILPTLSFSGVGKEKKLSSILIRYNARLAFAERSKTYEKSKRTARAPSFVEIVNSINSRQIFKSDPKISDEFKNLYGILSDYVHFGSAKLEWANDPKTVKSQSLILEDFDKVYDLGKRTLDAVLVLYTESMGRYYGFRDGNTFLKYLSCFIQSDGSTKKAFSLQFSKQISQGVIWQKHSIINKDFITIGAFLKRKKQRALYPCETSDTTSPHKNTTKPKTSS